MTQVFAGLRTLDPSAMQPQRTHFEYLEKLDVVVATPVWELDTEEDVLSWFQQYEDYYKGNFDKPVDTIFDLSYFHVGSGMGPKFGEYRAKFAKLYTGRTYRCHNDNERVKTYMYTSAVKYNAEANEFPTFEAAVTALLEDRKETDEAG